ncbi:MAG TPA: glycosyltransferase family 4 protein [Candidatus Paceibacterota bacterium]|nr:glycosyltransferase family 4 protein [Candidatus Paceibacterota bacterium]
MKLMICTQAVDRNDPILGFFLRWIEEFAKRYESVLVICLRKGDFVLPNNVEVIALGERWRPLRAFELCSIAFGRRAEYDTVFVHMNPEYLVAAGWLWRLLGKKTALWYVHKSVNLRLRIAEMFANVIFTASKESFRLPSKKVHIVGHGIDTSFFSPDPSVARAGWLLSVGRLMPSKRHDLVIRAAVEAGKQVRIAGNGPERRSLETLAHELGADVQFLGGLPHESLRDEYRNASAFIHTSETGSMDKVVLEALATDCPVITTSEAYGNLPVEIVDATPEALAAAITRSHSQQNRSEIIRAHHSLFTLVPRIVQELQRHDR